MINCLDDNIRVELGKSTPQGGEAALISLEKAVEDLKNGKIDVLITAPIDKQNVQSESFHFNGHTDYLKSIAGSGEALMFMIGESMRIGIATDHVPLSKVPGLITIDTIIQKIRLMNRSLILDFGIRKPRIAVLGLNPHAGDKSLLGSEEGEIIDPDYHLSGHHLFMGQLSILREKARHRKTHSGRLFFLHAIYSETGRCMRK